MFTTPAPARPATRLQELDALRGFALCGIIFVNIPQTMGMMDVIADAPRGLMLFVHGKFYPIFCLLFGVGFGLLLRSSTRRSDRPRVPLARRLLALGAIGGLHHLLQPGEVLLPYAIAGLVVLLPLSFASSRANLLAGTALTLAGLLTGIAFALLPGLLVLGAALARSGIVDTLRERSGQLAITVVACAAVGASAYWLVVAGVAEPLSLPLGQAFSLAVAVGYAAAFLLVALRPVAGAPLRAVLAPLGRMALTNYLAATLLFVPAGAALGLPGSAAWATSAALGAAILLAQVVWSPLWLRGFAYGPMEWLWRCATYWRILPLRQRATAAER